MTAKPFCPVEKMEELPFLFQMAPPKTSPEHLNCSSRAVLLPIACTETRGFTKSGPR